MIFATDDDRPNNALERQGLKGGYKLTLACLRLCPFLVMLSTAVVQFARVLPAESRMVQQQYADTAILVSCKTAIPMPGHHHHHFFPLSLPASAHKLTSAQPLFSM